MMDIMALTLIEMIIVVFLSAVAIIALSLILIEISTAIYYYFFKKNKKLDEMNPSNKNFTISQGKEVNKKSE